MAVLVAQRRNGATAQRRRRAPLVLEVLEDRTLLSANPQLLDAVRIQNDMSQLSNDVMYYAASLVNGGQSSSSHAPTPATIATQLQKTAGDVLGWGIAVLDQGIAQVENRLDQMLGAVESLYFTVLAYLDPASASPTLPTDSTSAPVVGSTSGTASSSGGHDPLPKSINDPLYVLDQNTGETVPNNVSLNTFATWNENLLAQVSGAAVSSYAWNVSQAPDLTNVSGTATANLQGSWASFTGPAHTDTISVTATPQSGSPLTQTMTFLVAGTDSPAYSASRPTNSSTWPSVITPDQLSSGQATQTAGQYAKVGLTDGSVQTSFSMPSYNPNTTPVSLDYNSTTANAQPIFLAEYQLPLGQAVPATITAQLTFNNTPLTTVTYNTANLNPGDIVQIALQANATGLSTGRYPWSITVSNGTNTNYSGSVNIVNQASSPFGAGWSLNNVDQLVSVSGGVMLVQPGGTSLWFASNGQGGFTTPAGDFSTLTLSNGVYTRTLTDGTKINFNSSGQQTSTVDRDGNTTTFAYNGSGQLTTITDMNGQVTTLAYNSSGLLSSITDPANRTATLAYSGKQLTSITDPASDVWQYAYDSANDLTKLTDPNGNATSFAYNFADRVSSVTQPDNTTEELTAEQMNGLAAPGSGTPSNPATAVLLAVGDQAQVTDANNNLWTTGLDWLGFGLPILATNPLGNTSLTYRDANGLPWLSADALGRRTRVFFNSQGNPTQIVNPDDSYAQYQYNSFSEPTQYIDPTGDTTTYTYNSKGDLTKKTDALAHNTTYAYNTAGLLTSTTDPLNHTTTYGYNALNEQTSVTNALNQTTIYTYNNAGQVVNTTDPLGFTNTYTYDALNHLTGKTLADTSTTSSTYTYTYDKAGNQTSATDPLNHVTNYSYNAVNEMTATTNALNQTTTYGYDANGNRTSVTNPLNQTTTYAYDAANWLVSVTDALNETTSYGYDAAGEKISQTNPLNQTTTYSYDARGWLATVTDPLNDQKSYSYDADGYLVVYSQLQVVAVAPLPMPPPGGSPPPPPPPPSGGGQTLSSSIVYNAVHEMTSYTDPMNDQTTYGYDADGNKTSVTDALSHTTTYAYNALNQLTSVTDALGDQTSYGYDANGNKTSVTDPLGHAILYTYDAQGRTLTATDANGGVTTYKYDLAGNLLSLTDPDNNTTSYSYNAVNELVSTTNPLGYQSTDAYDAAGELISATDADGRTIDYGYNAVGERTSETWVGGNYTATYQYNTAGQLTSASDPYSTYTYTYDAAGRQTSVSNAGTPGVPSVTLSYGYDAYGDRTSLTDSLGGSISYTYDGDLRLTGMQLTVNTAAAAQLTFGYDAASNLTGITRTAPSVNGDTLATSLTYDTANRLTNITHTDATQNVTLASYTYGYDAAGELTSYQGNNSSLSYGYDKAGQWLSASGTLAGQSYNVGYQYDANGNRSLPNYQTGKGNELLTDGTYNYTYDKDGNTLTQTNIASGTVTYFTWDYRNRLVEEKVEDSHGNVLNDEKFTYDVNNNRIGVSLNGVQQLWTVYDGANPYMDFNGNGQLTQRYLTNPNALSQFYGQVSGSGTTEWFLTDLVNSIRQVISVSGTSLDAIPYDPFGNIVYQTNANNAPRFLYTGATQDPLTANYQDGRRQESSLDGRWESPDPDGFAAGDTNLYRYVENAPTSHIDPTGEWAWPWSPGATWKPGYGIAGGVAGGLLAAGTFVVLVSNPVGWAVIGVAAAGTLGGGYIGGYQDNLYEASVAGATTGIVIGGIAGGGANGLRFLRPVPVPVKRIIRWRPEKLPPFNRNQ